MGLSMLDNLAVVILAAGKGTRMKSDMAKVLHQIHAIPMVRYVVGAAREVAGENIVVVVGHQAERVRQEVSRNATVRFALQDRQLGTGHAVSCALPALPPQADDIVILSGDVPLIRPETITALVADHRAAGRDLTLLAVDLPDPTGYGRIVMGKNRRPEKIVEEADATDDQKRIRLINAGIYCATRSFLAEVLPRLKADNAQREFYLTDITGIGHAEAKHIGVMTADEFHEILGVNTAEELRTVEGLMTAQRRIIS